MKKLELGDSEEGNKKVPTGAKVMNEAEAKAIGERIKASREAGKKLKMSNIFGSKKV